MPATVQIVLHRKNDGKARLPFVDFRLMPCRKFERTCRRRRFEFQNRRATSPSRIRFQNCFDLQKNRKKRVYCTKNDINALKSAYNRGNFTKGYSFDDTKNIMSEKVQGNIGLLVGKVASVDKQGYAEIRFLTKSRKDRATNFWTKTVLKSRAARFRKQKTGNIRLSAQSPDTK